MNKQLIKIMGHMIFIVLLTAPVNGITAPIMTDSFESGDLSHTENGVGWYGSTNTTVSSDISHTGNKSLRFTFEGKPIEKDSWAEQRFDLGNAYPEVWIQYYIYYPDGSEGISPRYKHRDSSPNNNKFIRLWGSADRRDKETATISGGASMFRTSTEYSRLGAEYAVTFNGSTVHNMGRQGIPTPDLVTSSTIGTWIKVKYHVKAATAANNDGVIQFWINDVLSTDEQSLALYPGNGYHNAYTAGYLFGWANSGFDENTNIYIDDIEISTKAFPEKAAPKAPDVSTMQP